MAHSVTSRWRTAFVDQEDPERTAPFSPTSTRSGLPPTHAQGVVGSGGPRAAGQPAGGRATPGQHEGRRHEGQASPVSTEQEALQEPAERRRRRGRRGSRPDSPPLPDDEGENVAALRTEGMRTPISQRRCETVVG